MKTEVYQCGDTQSQLHRYLSKAWGGKSFGPTSFIRRLVCANGAAYHNTSTHAWIVLAMAVSKNNALALTVSADHLIGRYDLVVGCVLSCF